MKDEFVRETVTSSPLIQPARNVPYTALDVPSVRRRLDEDSDP